MKKQPIEAFALILASFIVFWGVLTMSFATSCGPQLDREAMDDVKRTYCRDVMSSAADLEDDGTVLSPEELEAVRFCR